MVVYSALSRAYRTRPGPENDGEHAKSRPLVPRRAQPFGRMWDWFGDHRRTLGAGGGLIVMRTVGTAPATKEWAWNRYRLNWHVISYLADVWCVPAKYRMPDRAELSWQQARRKALPAWAHLGAPT